MGWTVPIAVLRAPCVATRPRIRVMIPIDVID